MDTSDPDIQFDSNGVCHYCHEFDLLKKSRLVGKDLELLREKTIERIQRRGKNRDFDCILGLSGGVDSSYMAYLAKQLGLRPLVVHFDNGWNNEIAVHNIEQIISRLGFELTTFVMDWPEFRDLQRSYFKASVLDLEVPTDHMIFGALYQIAAKHKIPYILSGNNIATEWLLPKKWYYSKFDLVNMRSIHKRFGTAPLKKLPAFGLWQAAYHNLILGISDIKLIELYDYKKSEAKKIIQSELGWRDYGGKHYESIFTRFYQGYILPRKFNIDKRKAHLSNLILNGEMTREQAIDELKNPTYPEDLQEQDKLYVAKKLGFSEEEFERILTLPNIRHEEYGTDEKERDRYFAIMKSIRPITSLVKRFKKKS
jgi:N-acetyl sugar amidotransferase